MRNEGARDKLKKQTELLTEEHVKDMLAWMRRRHTGRVRKRQTPLQQFEGNLESMTNEEVTEMVEGTRKKRPGYLALLVHLPALALKAIVKILGRRQTEKQHR